MNSSLRLVLGSSLLIAGACVDTAGTDSGDPGTDGDTEVTDRLTGAGTGEPVVSTINPKQPHYTVDFDGTYQLASVLDVEAQQLFPATAYDAMLILEGLRDRPAQTLFDLAEDAGVPAVGTIRDALPAAVESRLYGWIDGRIRTVTTGDGNIAQVIDTVLGVCHADIAELRLGSQLTIAGDTASHRLDTVELEVQGRALAYDIAPLAAIGAELDVAVDAACAADGALTIGAHGFSFPYGKIAWQATEDSVRARYGRDLRTLLGDQVNCPAMAAAVADECYWGYCVGHEAELEQICEAGLDRAVAEIKGRVEAATVQPIALDAGAATLTDGHITDGIASHVETGTWTARLDLGQGLRPSPATFTGERQ